MRVLVEDSVEMYSGLIRSRPCFIFLNFHFIFIVKKNIPIQLDSPYYINWKCPNVAWLLPRERKRERERGHGLLVAALAFFFFIYSSSSSPAAPSPWADASVCRCCVRLVALTTCGSISVLGAFERRRLSIEITNARLLLLDYLIHSCLLHRSRAFVTKARTIVCLIIF